VLANVGDCYAHYRVWLYCQATQRHAKKLYL